MKLTSEFIKEKLLAEFKDKKVGYSSFEVEGFLYRLLMEYAKENGYDEKYFNAKKSNHGNWSIDLLYKGYDIGTVEIKRTKGNNHYVYWGGYTDYFYKDFAVWTWEDPDKNESVETRIAEIDQIVMEKKDAETKKLELAREIFDMIKAKLKTDDYGTRQFIAYMHDKRYSISD